jgi:transposase
MASLFWLSEKQWTAIEPYIPTNRPGVKPKRNRQVISGIIHVLHVGCRWQDCPQEYGPYTTVYNRFNRWSKAGIWQAMLAGLVEFDAAQTQCIDSTTAKAHRCAAGGKGGLKSKPSAEAEVGEPPKSTPSWIAAGGSSRSA